jgi:hypothetical protein
MTGKPPSGARKAGADLWRHRPEAGDGRPARDQPNRRPEVQAVRDSEVTLATLGYLGAAFTGPVIPLGVYLLGGRISPFTRYHAAMALNQSLTGLLYAVCCLILGGVLALDSPGTALVIAIPIALALWLTTLRYLIRGIAAANRGVPNVAPAWICARIVT